MTPVISIIMPCFNAARHLHTSIASVDAQTFTDWERIAFDNGSTDESSALLDAFKTDEPRLRRVRQANAAGSTATGDATYPLPTHLSSHYARSLWATAGLAPHTPIAPPLATSLQPACREVVPAESNLA
jgi:hypothetical protein